jgi:hypothetical protein
MPLLLSVKRMLSLFSLILKGALFHFDIKFLITPLCQAGAFAGDSPDGGNNSYSGLN